MALLFNHLLKTTSASSYQEKKPFRYGGRGAGAACGRRARGRRAMGCGRAGHVRAPAAISPCSPLGPSLPKLVPPNTAEGPNVLPFKLQRANWLQEPDEGTCAKEPFPQGPSRRQSLCRRVKQKKKLLKTPIRTPIFNTEEETRSCAAPATAHEKRCKNIPSPMCCGLAGSGGIPA